MTEMRDCDLAFEFSFEAGAIELLSLRGCQKKVPALDAFTLPRTRAGMKALNSLHDDFPRPRCPKPFTEWLGDLQSAARLGLKVGIACRLQS